MTTSKKDKIYNDKKLEKEKQKIFKEAQQLNQAIYGFGEDDTATGNL